MIYKEVGSDFLKRYLHPEYSLVDYRFENVDLQHLDKIKIIAKPLDSKNKRKNQERYMRIAFESLAEFGEKENRKNYYVIDETNPIFIKIIELIRSGNNKEADTMIRRFLNDVALQIYNIENNIKRYKLNSGVFLPNMAAEDLQNK